MPISQKASQYLVPEVAQELIEEKLVLKPSSLKRTVQWIGGVNGGILFEVTEKIQALLEEDQLDPIYLLVTSHGGPTGIGMSFYDTMRAVYRPTLYTIGSGDVDSSGIIVFLTGSRRYLTLNTTLLLHLAGRTFDSPKRLTTPEMESIVKEDKLKDFQYASVIADRSGGRLTVQKVLDLMANNTVLTPRDAVEYGLAHSVIE
jgi:ATP-dependent protease ClpP protease subunit